MQHKLEIPFNTNNSLEFSVDWTFIKASEEPYDIAIVETRAELEKIQDKDDTESKELYAKLLSKLAKAYLDKFNNDKNVPPSFEGNNNLIALACALLGIKSKTGNESEFHRLASTACTNLSQLFHAGNFLTWPHTLAFSFPFLKETEARSYCQQMLEISADRHLRAARLIDEIQSFNLTIV